MPNKFVWLFSCSVQSASQPAGQMYSFTGTGGQGRHSKRVTGTHNDDFGPSAVEREIKSGLLAGPIS